MLQLTRSVTLLCFTIFLFGYSNAAIHTEEEITKYLEGDYETLFSGYCKLQNEAEWAYNTDITPEHEQAVVDVTVKNAEYEMQAYTEYFKDVNLEDIKDVNIRRQIKFLKNIGNAALEKGDLETLSQTINKMTGIYGAAKICPFNKKDCDLATEGLSLEPDIELILATSDNFEELQYAWEQWRDKTGKLMREDYKTYVNYVNKAAKLNGFEDNSLLWIDAYETENFIEEVDKIWEQVEPLYSKLHAYVRSKLVDKYGEEVMGEDDLIPANILGNMWAQSWENIEKLVTPYPNETEVDVTAALQEQGYDALKMFQTSDDFYTSLGLPNNQRSFQADCMIEKPGNKEVVCHASAWDFCDKKTFKIKMCTEVNNEDFITIHHEMGHIQYFILYKNQPLAFRTGANPGFHEAVGDTIALSVSTPQHLTEIGLLKDYVATPEATINTLMRMALQKIAFLPFGLLIDKWRWDVFSGEVEEKDWNARWWEYRGRYQKVKPPGGARDETNFDPGSKFHVAADSQYINYFVSHILQFQLYRGLCITAGKYDPNTKQPPLHECDFYKNEDVGNKLRAGLSLGARRHWKESLYLMTGETELDPSALLEYFQPLTDFLTGDDGNEPEPDSASARAASLLLTLLCSFILYKYFS